MNRAWARQGGMGLVLSLALSIIAQAEDGARAGADLWAAPSEPTLAAPVKPSPASAPDLEGRVDTLEQSVVDLEGLLGSPRGLRARQPFERRLGDLETRLNKLEKQVNTLERRLRRVEARK